MTISIRKPMMRADTGRREVGLAVDKVYLEGNLVDIEITYTRKDGSPLYVNKFVGRREDILACPQKVYKGIRLAYVPLDILKQVTPKSEPTYYKTEPRNLGDKPTKPCWNCKGTKFQQVKWGEWICCFCHPNPNPSVDTTKIDVKEQPKEQPIEVDTAKA